MRAKLDEGFEEFVRARSVSLLRAATLLTGDRYQAQDLVQTTLWRTYRHWGRALSNPDAYARRVLVHLVHDQWRHTRRRVTETALDHDAPGATADTAAEIVERDALIAALRLVPARQRATLVLRFWEDMSVDETASILGCSAGNVKSNTSRGLANLREILDSQTQSELNLGGLT